MTSEKVSREIVTAIKAYVNGQINESVKRCAFRQQEGETFDDFLVSLTKMCNFCDDACTQALTRSSQI